MGFLPSTLTCLVHLIFFIDSGHLDSVSNSCKAGFLKLLRHVFNSNTVPFLNVIHRNIRCTYSEQCFTPQPTKSHDFSSAHIHINILKSHDHLWNYQSISSGGTHTLLRLGHPRTYVCWEKEITSLRGNLVQGKLGQSTSSSYQLADLGQDSMIQCF